MHTYNVHEMVVRTVRAAVKEHSQKDPLDPQTYHPDMSDVCPGTDAPSWLKEWVAMTPQEHLKERLEMYRSDREARMMFGEESSREEEILSVQEILEKGLYKIKGKSRDFESVHCWNNGILVEVQYSKRGWRAGYEVGPRSSQRPRCWYD